MKGAFRAQYERAGGRPVVVCVVCGALVFASLLARALSAAEIVVAEAGAASPFVVALPETPHPAESFAAAELCEHVEKMTGVRLSVILDANGEEVVRCVPRVADMRDGWNWIDVGTLKLSPGHRLVLRPPQRGQDASLRAVYADAVKIEREGGCG